MEQGVCILLAFAFASAVGRLPRPAATAAAAAVVAGLAYEAAVVRRHARELTQPVDVTQAPEYRLAAGAAALGPDVRVWAEGSAGFWLNAFAPNPQLHGGFDQGVTNELIPAVTFGIQNNRDAGAQNLAWMRALGVDGLLVGGYDAGLGQPSVEDTEKFAGHFEEVWRDGPLAVWRTPRRSSSLARVLFADERVPRVPEHALDIGPVQDFVAAIEDGSRPLPETKWLANDRLEIRAAGLAPDHWLYVQISYHPGWSAAVDGRPAPVERSLLGMTLVEPRCTGDCVVEMAYDGGTEMLSARLATGAALVFGSVWLALERRRGRRRS